MPRKTMPEETAGVIDGLVSRIETLRKNLAGREAAAPAADANADAFDGVLERLDEVMPLPDAAEVSTEGLDSTFAAMRGTSEGVARRMIENGMVNARGDTTGDPLAEVIAGLDGNGVKKLNDYILARRALAVMNDPRNPRDAGISAEWAQKTVAELGSGDFKRRADLFYEWQRGLTRYAGGTYYNSLSR
jgi:hypothetical protein